MKSLLNVMIFTSRRRTARNAHINVWKMSLRCELILHLYLAILMKTPCVKVLHMPTYLWHMNPVIFTVVGCRLISMRLLKDKNKSSRSKYVCIISQVKQKRVCSNSDSVFYLVRALHCDNQCIPRQFEIQFEIILHFIKYWYIYLFTRNLNRWNSMIKYSWIEEKLWFVYTSAVLYHYEKRRSEFCYSIQRYEKHGKIINIDGLKHVFRKWL